MTPAQEAAARVLHVERAAKRGVTLDEIQLFTNDLDAAELAIYNANYVPNGFALAASTVDAGQNSNANGVALTHTAARTDTGWTSDGASWTYSGPDPDHVEISAVVYQSAAVTRAAPALRLMRNGVAVATAASGYIRNGSAHIRSSNTIEYTDPAPGASPVYRLEAFRGSSVTGAVPVIDPSSFSCKAIPSV